MEDIIKIKEELYISLKIYEEVIGIGIAKEQNSDNKYILVYLSELNKNIQNIPTTYKGYKVETKITGNFKFH